MNASYKIRATKIYMFLIKSLFILTLASMGSTIASAQTWSPPKPIEIVFVSGNRHTPLVTNNFPQVTFSFLVLENGNNSQTPLTSLTILEDGVPIKELLCSENPRLSECEGERLPLDVVVIVQVRSFEGIEEENDTQRIAGGVSQRTQTDDQFWLCLTLGEPSCAKRDESFGELWEGLRSPVMQQADTVMVPLPTVLFRALDQSETDFRQHRDVVILIRSNDAGLADMTVFDESLLDRIRAAGGTFVMIDELYQPPDENQLDSFLTRKGLYYFSLVDGKDGCERVGPCLDQVMTLVRPIQYTISYDSHLVRDRAEHEVAIQAQFGENQTAKTITEILPFSFIREEMGSSLKNFVAKSTYWFTIIPPLLLMVLLVLTKKPNR